MRLRLTGWGPGAAGSPAIFTLNGTGTGPAALFQYDLVKGEISLNGDKTPAVKGNILITDPMQMLMAVSKLILP